MGIKRCPNGHFYDDSKFEACPHCEDGSAFQKHAGYSHLEADGEDDVVTFASVSAPAVSAASVLPGIMADEDATVAYYERDGISPVVGWLVQMTGDQRGLDHRLVNGRNPLTGLLGCPATQKAFLVYDARGNGYYMSVDGDDRDDFYVNDKPLEAANVRLSSWDKIRYQETELLFVALCREEYIW